jgi:hypothetical protein
VFAVPIELKKTPPPDDIRAIVEERIRAGANAAAGQ